MTAAELKASILDLAVRGQLVPQDSKDKPADKPSDIDDPPYELPRNWVWKRLGEITEAVGGRENQIPAKAILHQGKFPVVSQGQSLVDGYFNDETKVVSDVPVIMFGDHTRNVKYVDFPFVIGADGTKFFKTIVDTKWLYYWTVFQASQIGPRGYGRHWGLLNAVLVALPPLPEQKRIVAKIEELLPLVEEYGAAQKELETLNADFPAALRESILQDAVQGKLTAGWRKSHRGESAADLLAQIAAEKKRLLTAKKIKKEKSLPPITDDEKPFEIPDTWAWCRLGEIGQWGSGATPSKANRAYYQGGKIPWLVTGDLTDGDVTDIPGRITDLALEETSVRLNPPGSVLLAMYGATIGKLGILQVASTTNQACCACQTMPGLYNRYLFYYLLSQRRAFQKRGEGGAQPNISKEKIVVTPFPLPPLAEQKAIVERVDELLKIVDAMKAQ